MRKVWQEALSAILGAYLAVGSIAPAAAANEPARAGVTVRVGEHTGFGRIVFDLPPGASAETAIEGNRVLVVFAGADTVGLTGATARNVASLRTDGASATLLLAAGAKPRVTRMGSRLVIDVLDPAPSAEALPVGGNALTAANGPAAMSAGPRGSKLGRVAPPAVAVPSLVRAAPEPNTAVAPAGALGDSPKHQDLVPDPQPDRAAAIPAQKADDRGSEPGNDARHGGETAAASPATVPVYASILNAPEGKAAGEVGRRAVLLSADASVGAAAFSRGGNAVVVLDRRLALEPPAGLADAVVLPGAATTVVRFPLSANQHLGLKRVASGWSLEFSSADQPAGLPISAAPDGVAFPLAKPGRSVSIVDPASGGTLLVGTSLGDGPADAVELERRAPEYMILPTVLGVVIEPLSDHENLRAGKAGFVLSGAVPTMVSAAPADRRFDLPNEPVAALMNRMRLQLASAAQAEPRARTVSRVAEAQAMLALGLGVEAQAVLEQAALDDPQASEDARLSMLHAMAAVTAGRPEEAGALDDPRLQDMPETALWKGLRDRRLGRESPDARNLASLAAAAWRYPEPLRRLIWPDVAEAAAESGVKMAPDQLTPFASALLIERQGDAGATIDAWKALANSSDRLDSVRAGRRAIEAELAAGQIDAAQASERLENLTMAWRGDRRELQLRLRAAELRAAAGQWRAALDLLRQADQAFQGSHDEIQQRKTAIFEAMLLAKGGTLSAMDVVLMANDFADCVPDDAAGSKLAALLADKLMALDLSARAIPVLQGLVKATVAGPARAEFGTRLAQLLLESGDPAGAASALHASEARNPTPGTGEKRGLLLARAQADQGHVHEAVDLLQQIASPEADDLRAALLAKSGDWRGASLALADLATKTLPAEGALDRTSQAVVIRQATAASQSSDLAALQQLQRQIPRMTGDQANLLRVLTETPVTTTRELPRAASELALARNIPQHLQSISGR